MPSAKLPVMALCIVFCLTAVSSAVSMERRQQLGLKMGVWPQETDSRTEVGVGGVSSSVSGGDFFGGLTYSYWASEGLALNLDISGMSMDISADVGLTTVSSKTATVGSILMGVTQYFPKSTYGSSVRPFARIGGGIFIGTQELSIAGIFVVYEKKTEATMGARIGTGIDFILGRHFMVGTELGYILMTDFDSPIGGSRNYSGPECAFSFSYLFGKGIE